MSFPNSSRPTLCTCQECARERRKEVSCWRATSSPKRSVQGSRQPSCSARATPRPQEQVMRNLAPNRPCWPSLRTSRRRAIPDPKRGARRGVRHSQASRRSERCAARAWGCHTALGSVWGRATAALRHTDATAPRGGQHLHHRQRGVDGKALWQDFF